MNESTITGSDSSFLKTLANRIAVQLEERDFASFLRMNWNEAGQATSWRDERREEWGSRSFASDLGPPGR